MRIIIPDQIELTPFVSVYQDKVIRRREEAEEEGFAAMFEAKMEPTTAAAATTELAMEHALSPTGLMTPPISSRKSFDPLQLAVSSKKENRL